MEKQDKMILKRLVEKEIEWVEKEEDEIVFPELNFLKGREEYEVRLKKLLKKLNE